MGNNKIQKEIFANTPFEMVKWLKFAQTFCLRTFSLIMKCLNFSLSNHDQLDP